MTSGRRRDPDPEHDLTRLLPALQSLDDQTGPDRAFVDGLQQRLMGQHAASSSGPAIVGPPSQPPRFPAERRDPEPCSFDRRGWGVATGFLVAAALVIAALTGSPAVLRLLAPDAPAGTHLTAGITTGNDGATPSPVEFGAPIERGNAGRTGEVAGRGPLAEPAVLWTVPLLDDHYFSPEDIVATTESIFVTGWEGQPRRCDRDDGRVRRCRRRRNGSGAVATPPRGSERRDPRAGASGRR